MLIGYITGTKFFNGRRITAMVICILFLTFWDIIWVSITDINVDVDPNQAAGKHFLAKDLKMFDMIMFQGENLFSWVIYYMIIISGPIDLCRMYMLRENKRIYALREINLEALTRLLFGT